MDFKPRGNSVNNPFSSDNISSRFLIDENTFSGDKDLHGSEKKSKLNKVTVVVVIVSAVIFVTVVAIYEALKSYITNYYAKRSLQNSKANNSPEEIQRSLVANRENLKAGIVFALITIISAIIIITIAIRYVRNHKEY